MFCTWPHSQALLPDHSYCCSQEPGAGFVCLCFPCTETKISVFCFCSDLHFCRTRYQKKNNTHVALPAQHHHSSQSKSLKRCKQKLDYENPSGQDEAQNHVTRNGRKLARALSQRSQPEQKKQEQIVGSNRPEVQRWPSVTVGHPGMLQPIITVPFTAVFQMVCIMANMRTKLVMQLLKCNG